MLENPNIFTSVTTMMEESVPVPPAEQRVLADAHAQSSRWAEEIRPLSDRAWAPTFEDEPQDQLIGTGGEVAAFALQRDGQEYILRCPHRDGGSREEAKAAMQVRLLALARARVHGIHCFEQLVTFSFTHAELPWVVTTRAKGRYVKQLAPEQIVAISDEHIAALVVTAQQMETANLVADVDPSPTAVLIAKHAAYDEHAGPSFFDYEIIEQQHLTDGSTAENFVALVHSLAATEEHLPDRRLPLARRVARIILLNRALDVLYRHMSHKPVALNHLDRTIKLLEQGQSPFELDAEKRRLLGI